MTKLFAKAGAEIRGEGGKLIAVLGRDVNYGERVMPDQFSYLAKPAVEGDILPPEIAKFAKV